MNSSTWIAQKRVLAESQITKVAYPGKVAVNSNPLYASIGCSASFVPLSYSIALCGKVHPAKICIGKV